MPPVVATPSILTDPGFLWAAPIGSSDPTNTVTGSKFTDTVPVAWVPLGATSEGSTFNYSSTVEPVRVAELYDPIAYFTTERSGNIAFNLASYTLSNFNRAVNGGVAPLTPTGSGATSLTTFEPPDPGEEVRCMILWESTDATVRIRLKRVINGSEVSMAFQKAPSFATIPFQFQMEIPQGTSKPFTVWGAGTGRV
jgi:hypothetical protein